MDSMFSFDISSVVFRHVEKHEQQQTLDIWCAIFKTNRDLEERYFSSNTSPRYQEGDTLGAWHSNKLVSTVHIRRFILQSRENNEKYLCAGITNVATVAEYRRQGLSRHLLQMAVDKLENSNEFDMSMLGTRKPSHYAAFGWEQVPEPTQVMIDWRKIGSSNINVEWRSASNDLCHTSELLFKVHSDNPRIYQMDRSPLTVFQHWVRARWQNNAAIVCLYEQDKKQGYVVIGQPDSEKDVCVLEWRAPCMSLEKTLLSLAAAEIRRRHGSTKYIHLFALPQYMSIDELIEWAGPVQIGINQDIMMRNIQLPISVYEKVKTAHASGHAVFWSGDYF